MTRLVAGASVAMSLVVAACVHDSGEPGPLSGPSGLGLSIRLSASPDILPSDGAAKAIVTVIAEDDTGNPVASLDLTVQIVTGGVFQDVGQLSARSVTTGSNGQTSFSYTAPLLSTNPAGSTDNGGGITILVTPSSTDFANNVGRQLLIRLVPPGTVIPPFGANPGFEFTPATATVFDQIRFSAALCAAGDTTSTNCTRDPNGVIVSYAWDFGDGSTATGQQVEHTYETAGTYLVRLTIADPFNRAAETTQSIIVGAGTPPAAAFTFSPTAPSVGDTIFFDASGSTPSAGRTIVAYEWNFGDGSTGTGVTTSHVFTVEDTYTVTLNVTDDKGQVGTMSSTVPVGDSLPTAVITYSPQTPAVGQTVFFSAEQSSVTDGRTIVGYRWVFGDGSATTDGPNTTHVFTAGDDYVVQLFVTDDFGETGMTTVTITVGGTGTTATAVFEHSPTGAVAGEPVTFDASGSTPSPGATIVSYTWNFGDSSNLVTRTGPTTIKVYGSSGAYSVTLTIVDSNGVTATTMADVTIGGTGPSASFAVSPSSADIGVAINVNASASTPGSAATITSYAWDWGDGSMSNSGTSATTSDPAPAGYAAAGTYTITLTVTDSNGDTATATQTVTISADPPVASFTVSPSAAATGVAINVNGSASTAGTGATIASYAWDWGDGTTSNSGVSPTTSDPAPAGYAVAGTYTITLTITDSNGNTDTATQTVTIS